MLYEDKCRYDFEGVFWNSLYGIGIVGLGWVAIKAGVMIADTQITISGLLNAAAIQDLNKQIEVLEAAIQKSLPSSASLPWWIMPVAPFSVLALNLWDFLRTLVGDPGVEEDLAAMASDLQDLYNERAALQGEVVESSATKFVRKADAVYGRYGPIVPVGLLGFNALNEMIRVRRLEEKVE